MSFLTELQARDDHQINFVIDIDSTIFSSFEPDSGLTVPAANRIIQTITFPATSVDLKRARQKINLANVKVVDRDEIFSQAIGAEMGKDRGQTAIFAIKSVLRGGRHLFREMHACRATPAHENRQEP